MSKKHNHTFLPHNHEHSPFFVGLEDLFEVIVYGIQILRKNAYHNNNQQILDSLPTDLKDVKKFINNLELAILTDKGKEDLIEKFFKGNFKKGNEEAIVNFLYAIYKNPNILGGHDMAEKVYHIMLNKLTDFIASSQFSITSFSSILSGTIKNDKVNKVNIETSTFENFLKQAERNEKIAGSKEFKFLQEVLQEAIEEQNEAQKPAKKLQKLSNWLNKKGEKLEESNKLFDKACLYAIRAGVLAILATFSVSISNTFFNDANTTQNQPRNQVEFWNKGIDLKTQAVANLGNCLILLNSVMNSNNEVKKKHKKTAKIAKAGAGFDFLSDLGTAVLSFAESLKEGLLTGTSATIVMVPHVLVDNFLARAFAPVVHTIDDWFGKNVAKKLFGDEDKFKIFRLIASTFFFSTVGAGIIAGLQATPQLIKDAFSQPETTNTTQVEEPSNKIKPIKASPVVKNSSTVHLQNG